MITNTTPITIQRDTAKFQGVLVVSDVDFDSFLRDPIGFGDFDYADPISLGEFAIARHNHRPFLDVVS